MNNSKKISGKILITAALPYANGSIHLGHMVEYIQADIYARFLRLIGKDVIFLCADDAHGTPIYIKARDLDISPELLIAKYNEEHQRDFLDFQVSFDHYYSTHSPENEKHALLIFEQLRQKGHIVTRDVQQYYCEKDGMFLADRFIKGKCPKCAAEDQYGDVCENCGSHYNATELLVPYCALCSTRPVIRGSEHYFFRLADFTQELTEWAGANGHLQAETLHSIQDWLSQGLKDWDISRDAPYFGFRIPGEDSKYFYVWLDAPVGYIATTENYCTKNNKDFNAYWNDPDASIYHFIGKDIIYFHTLFWPAMLKGSGYNLPSAVFVHGFLTVDGKKMSKSRGTFLTARHYLDHLGPEYLRYYYATKLSANSDDIDLNLEDFRAKVNSDLVNKILNIGSRAAAMLHKNFKGEITEMNSQQQEIFDDFIQQAGSVHEYYMAREFAKAMILINEIADKTNRYFSDERPWNTLSQYPDHAWQICSFSLNVIRLLSLLLKPVLPKVSAEIEAILRVDDQRWIDADRMMGVGHRVLEFGPLLQRVDHSKVEEMIKSNL